MDDGELRPGFYSLSGTITGNFGFYVWNSQKTWDALALLHVQLENALFLARPDLAPRHRWRYEAAITAIVRFLNEHAVPAHILGEFLELALALIDLDRGVVHPMLAPAKVSHRRPIRSDVWRARAHVVVAAECLIASGMRKSDTCRHIAKELLAARLTLANKEEAKKQRAIELFTKYVAKWIDSFRADAIKDELAAAKYRGRETLIGLWARKLATTDMRAIGEATLTESALFAARATDQETRDKIAAEFAAKRARTKTPSP